MSSECHQNIYKLRGHCAVLRWRWNQKVSHSLTMSLIEPFCTANNAVLLRRDDPWDHNGGMSLGAFVQKLSPIKLENKLSGCVSIVWDRNIPIIWIPSDITIVRCWSHYSFELAWLCGLVRCFYSWISYSGVLPVQPESNYTNSYWQNWLLDSLDFYLKK